jgi:hypothetical protein
VSAQTPVVGRARRLPFVISHDAHDRPEKTVGNQAAQDSVESLPLLWKGKADA